MKLLVVGASGYVGSRLVKDLSAGGYEVVAGVHSAAGARALGSVFSGKIFAGDVQDAEYRARLLDEGCEALLYLASLNYQQFGGHPGALLGVKVEPFWHFLSDGLSRGLARAVFFSTQQVYGNFGAPTREDSRPQPASGYGLAHRLGEEVAEFFHRTSSLSACSLRLANVVGAGGCYREEFLRFAVTDMCHQALSTGRISLRSGRDVARDFVPLAYVSSAVDLLLRSPKSSLFDGAFNIGSGAVRSIADVAELVARLSGRDVAVEIGEGSAASSAPAQPNDITRLKSLGFASGATLEGAIRETFDFLTLS